MADVAAFLGGRLPFSAVYVQVVEEALNGADGAEARDLDDLVVADAAARRYAEEALQGHVSITIAILGLAFLILVHEAGTSSWPAPSGWNPRRFYLGFPPALVKVKRKGIEYGIGAIPLGGYVKIPGMHRPAASGLRLAARAGDEGGLEALSEGGAREALAEQGDLIGGREALPELERALDEANLTSGAERMARRGFNELRDGLADDAYWRQRTSKRVAVIFAGPAANILLAILLPTIAYLIGAPGHTSRTVDTVQDDSRPAIGSVRATGRLP